MNTLEDRLEDLAAKWRKESTTLRARNAMTTPWLEAAHALRGVMLDECARDVTEMLRIHSLDKGAK